MKIHTVTLPDIGEGVVEGEVIKWLKEIGDEVKQDEPVVIVMTDKATVELPAPVPGILAKQYYKVAEIAIKDKPLYDIEVKEIEHGKFQEKENEKVIQEASLKPKVQEKPKIKAEDTGEVLAIPKVRKMALDLGVDLTKVKGSGKDGRILQEDLQAHIQHDSLKDSLLHLKEDKEVPLVGVRHLMAKKMTESKQHIPHFSFFEQVDVTRLVKLKEKYKEEGLKEGLKVTYMPFIIKALSLTLLKFPEVNSSYDELNHTLILHKPHNIGIAISTSFGLIVPVLKDVQEMHLNEIIRSYEDLKTRAFNNQLDVKEMKESTITITNFGVFGGRAEFATPIINYPEVAILGVARIQKEPAIKGDLVVSQDTLHLSWSFDHRVIDGDMAAKFSNYFANLLYNPAVLLG